MREHTDDVAALAVLAEPLRRRVYDHVAGHPSGVSRDGTAQVLGVPRSVAAFHLDKLVAAGLLEVDYRRPPGRNGPGAGRPAKWYSRAEGVVAVSIPQRRYELAATLMARALERSARSSREPVAAVLATVAREHGRDLGVRVDDSREEPSLSVRLLDVLAAEGYEPRVEDGVIVMANCPFHALASEHRELVCSMNRELLCGLADVAGLAEATVRLDPEPSRCCVTIAL